MKNRFMALGMGIAMILAAVPAFARPAYIDWENGVVIARGEAAPQAGQKEDDATLTSQAIENARTNMVYVIEQVILDANQDVAGHLAEHPEKRTRLNDLIGKATVLNEEKGADGKKKVTLSLAIGGADGLESFMNGLKTGAAAPAPAADNETPEAVKSALAAASRGRTAEQVGKPYRIAVPAFLNATDFQGIDLGREARDLLAASFAKEKRFQILESSESAALLGESGLAAEDVLKADLTQKLALKGVDGVLAGRIVKYERQEKKLGVGGAGYLSLSFLFWIEVRIYDAVNDRWAFDEVVKEEIKDTKSTLNSADDPEKFIDINNLNSDRGLAALAVRSNVEKMNRILRSTFPLEGYVLKVMGEKVYVNLTSLDGVREGDALTLRRVGDVLTDPVTGEEIGRIRDRIGMLSVRESRENYSMGAAQDLLEGAVRVGDIVTME